MWTGLVWLRIGTGELCNEPSGSIKCWELPSGCTGCDKMLGTTE
jgi:hypothetical protein